MTIPRTIHCDTVFHIPLDGKITAFEEHPVKPWIVTAHDTGIVNIYDYQQKTHILSYNIAEKDERRREKVNQIRNFERNAEYKGPKDVAKILTKKAPGTIKSITFFDSDVKNAYSLLGIVLDREASSCPSTIGHPNTWIIVNAETRIVFLNYVTLQTKDLKLSLLDGKAQNCCKYVGLEDLIAFGGADGVIRIFDCCTWTTLHRVTSSNAHKSIEQMLCHVTASNESMIVTSGTEGNMLWWKNFECEPVSKRQNEVFAMTYNPIVGSVIATTGAKTVQWWRLTSGECIETLNPNKQFVRATSFHHPRVPPRSLLVLQRGVDSKLSIFNEIHGMFELNDVEDSFKKCKFQDIRVHTFHPNVIFAFCNRSGIYILNVSSSLEYFPSFYSANPTSLMFADPLNNLVSLDEKRTVLQKLSIVGGVPRISTSGSGRFVSIFWPDLRKFHLYDRSHANWQLVEKDEDGFTIDFVWSSNGDQFATITIKVFEETPEAKKKSKLGGVLKSGRASQVLSKSLKFVIFRTLDNSGKVTLVRETENPKARKLFGGLLLGLAQEPSTEMPVSARGDGVNKRLSTVAKSRTTTLRLKSPKSAAALPSMASSEEEQQQQMVDQFQFFDWSGSSVGGGLLFEPTRIIWDRQESYCCIVYDSFFLIYQTRPLFSLILKRDISIDLGLWMGESFVYSTSERVEMIFPRAPNHAPFILASTNLPEAVSLERMYNSPKNAHIRPMGVLALLYTQSPKSIGLLDAHGNSFLIPISAPLIQFCISASNGELEACRSLIPSLSGKDEYLAQFLCAIGLPEEAVAVPGISCWFRINICVENGLSEEAAKILPEVVNDALENNKVEEAKNVVAQCVAIAKKKGDKPSEENYYKIASRLDESFYFTTLVIFSSHSKKKLKSLTEKLSKAGHYSLAAFCTQLLDDTESTATLLKHGRNLSELIAFTGREAATANPENMRSLDQMLQQDQKMLLEFGSV